MYKIVFMVFLTLNILLGKGIPGKFDYYELSLTWLPGFCQDQKNQKNSIPKECKIINKKDFSSNNFSLHGLWPNVKGDTSHSYENCRFGYKVCLDKGSSCWCSQKSLGFSNEQLFHLQKYMPGVYSCLQKHEWYKHGDCTLFSKEEYFEQSVALVKQFSQSRFNKYITSNKNQYITNADIKSKFENAFGKGSSVSLKLVCSKTPPLYLKEIQFAIKKKFNTKNISASIINKPNGDFTSFVGCGDDSNEVYIQSFDNKK